jgi:hypothetical protein
MSDYLEAEVLNAVLRGQTTFLGATLTGKLANVYLALHSADPTDAGTGTELSGGGYARVAVSTANGSWSAPADNSGAQRVSNASAISFPQSTGSQGTATYIAWWSASTGGNMLWSGALAASIPVTAASITVTFDAGAITVDQS